MILSINLIFQFYCLTLAIIPDLSQISNIEIGEATVCDSLVTCTPLSGVLIKQSTSLVSIVYFKQSFTSTPQVLILPTYLQNTPAATIIFSWGIQTSLTACTINVDISSSNTFQNLILSYMATTNPYIKIQGYTLKQYSSKAQTYTVKYKTPYQVVPQIFGHLTRFAVDNKFDCQVVNSTSQTFEINLGNNDFSDDLYFQTVIVNQSMILNNTQKLNMDVRTFNIVPNSSTMSLKTNDLMLYQSSDQILVGLQQLIQNLDVSLSFRLISVQLSNNQYKIFLTYQDYTKTSNSSIDIASFTTQTCLVSKGVYFSGTECQPCHRQCQSCWDGLNTSCLTCPTSIYRYQNYSSCYCQDGYFDDGFSAICMKCDQTCLTCSNSTASDCLSCNISLNRYIQYGQCLCQSQFESVIGTLVCQKISCSPLCQTCFGSGNNKCLTCDDSLNRYNFNNTCTCSDGYYDDGSISCQCTSLILLLECKETCKTCSDLSTCLSCFEPLVLQEGFCINFQVTQHEVKPSNETIFLDTNESNINTTQPTKSNSTETLINTTNPSPNITTTIDPGHLLDCKQPGSKNKCEFDCHPLCETCYGPLITQCESCKLSQSYQLLIDTLGIQYFPPQQMIFILSQFQILKCVGSEIFIQSDFRDVHMFSRMDVLDESQQIVYQSSTVSVNNSQNTFQIERGILDGQTNYKIQITVFDSLGVDVISNSTNITTLPTGMVATVLGGDSRWGTEQWNTIQVQIYNLSSSTPLFDSINQFYFQWKCYDYYGLPCSDKFGKLLVLNQSDAQRFRPNTLTAYRGFQFSVVINHKSKDIQLSCDANIQIFEGILPTLILSYDPMLLKQSTFIQQENKISFQYNSSISPDSLFYSANLYYDYSIVSTIVFKYSEIVFTIWDYFDQFTTNQGLSLYFVGSVFNPMYQSPSQASIKFQVFLPPQGCQFKISPQSGYEQVTQFFAVAQSCDGMNLKYKFGYYISTADYEEDILYSQFNKLVSLSDFQISNRIGFTLPRTYEDMVIMQVSIRDSIGAVENITQRVSISAQNLDTEQLQKQINLNMNHTDVNVRLNQIISLLTSIQGEGLYWGAYKKQISNQIKSLNSTQLTQYQSQLFTTITFLYYKISNMYDQCDEQLTVKQLKYIRQKLNDQLQQKRILTAYKKEQGCSIQIQQNLHLVDSQIQQSFQLIGSTIKLSQAQIGLSKKQNKKIAQLTNDSLQLIQENAYLDIMDQTPNQRISFFNSSLMSVQTGFLSYKYMSSQFQQETTFTRRLLSNEMLRRVKIQKNLTCCYIYSFINFEVNPYLNEQSFPYPLQNYSVSKITLQKIQKSKYERVTSRNHISYGIKMNSNNREQVQNETCIQNNGESWQSENCSIQQTSTSKKTCYCLNFSSTTVVQDTEGKFSQKTVFTQASLDAISSFIWYEAILTYIFAGLTILYISLLVWGQRQDFFDSSENPNVKTVVLGSNTSPPKAQSADLDTHRDKSISNKKTEKKSMFKYFSEQEKALNLNDSASQDFNSTTKTKFHHAPVEKLEDASVMDENDNDNGKELYVVDYLKPVPHIVSQQIKVDQDILPFHRFLLINHPILNIYSIYNKILSRPLRATLVYLTIIQTLAMVVFFGYVQITNIKELQVLRTLMIMTFTSLATNATIIFMRSLLSSQRLIISYIGIFLFLCLVCFFCFMIMAVVSLTKTVEQTNVWATQYVLSFLGDYLIFAPLRSYFKYRVLYLVLGDKVEGLALLFKKVLFNPTDLEIIKQLLM